MVDLKARLKELKKRKEELEKLIEHEVAHIRPAIEQVNKLQGFEPDHFLDEIRTPGNHFIDYLAGLPEFPSSFTDHLRSIERSAREKKEVDTEINRVSRYIEAYGPEGDEVFEFEGVLEGLKSKRELLEKSVAAMGKEREAAFERDYQQDVMKAGGAVSREEFREARKLMLSAVKMAKEGKLKQESRNAEARLREVIAGRLAPAELLTKTAEESLDNLQTQGALNAVNAALAYEEALEQLPSIHRQITDIEGIVQTKRTKLTERKKGELAKELKEIEESIGEAEKERTKAFIRFDRVSKENMDAFKALHEVAASEIPALKLPKQELETIEAEFNRAASHPLYKFLHGVKLDMKKGVIPSEDRIRHVIDIAREVPLEGVMIKGNRFFFGGFPLLKEHGERFGAALQRMRSARELAKEFSDKTADLYRHAKSAHDRSDGAIVSLKRRHEEARKKLEAL
jgi:hypothetical protein